MIERKGKMRGVTSVNSEKEKEIRSKKKETLGKEARGDERRGGDKK